MITLVERVICSDGALERSKRECLDRYAIGLRAFRALLSRGEPLEYTRDGGSLYIGGLGALARIDLSDALSPDRILDRLGRVVLPPIRSEDGGFPYAMISHGGETAYEIDRVSPGNAAAWIYIADAALRHEISISDLFGDLGAGELRDLRECVAEAMRDAVYALPPSAAARAPHVQVMHRVLIAIDGALKEGQDEES